MNNALEAVKKRLIEGVKETYSHREKCGDTPYQQHSREVTSEEAKVSKMGNSDTYGSMQGGQGVSANSNLQEKPDSSISKRFQDSKEKCVMCRKSSLEHSTPCSAHKNLTVKIGTLPIETYEPESKKLPKRQK